MGQYACSICDDRAVCRAVDEELGKGGSGEFVARLMTFRGFKTTAPTINQHKKHAVNAIAPVAKAPRDFAILVRDKALELFDAEKLDLTKRKHIPGIQVGLRAQSEVNKQVNRSDDRKTAVAIAMILSGASTGGPPEGLQLADGLAIEGEFEEIDPVVEIDPEIETPMVSD